MHIEPGIVTGAKLALSYATAAGATAYAVKLSWDAIREKGVLSLSARALICTVLTLVFFELLPHFTVGVSEVHFILGSSLLLMLGVAPAAIGLALGLALQALILSPSDIPQFGANLTTLLVPLFAIHLLAQRIIPSNTAYVDLSYRQAASLSSAYQAGIVTWVAFWAFYGSGFGAENLTAVGTFAASYMVAVVAVEPLMNIALLAGAKSLHGTSESALFEPRLHNAV